MASPAVNPRLPGPSCSAEGDGTAALETVKDGLSDPLLAGVIAAGFREAGRSVAWIVSGGYADIDAGEPLSPQRPMLAGSISKLLTATLVLRMVADGAVRLDDPANQHLSSLRVASDAVNVRQLLTHTSGVSSAFEHFVDEVPPAREVLGGEVAVEFRPGSQLRYSNGGYAVLGEIVAHVRGRCFRHVVEEEVFAPLGMSRSKLLVSWPNDVPQGYAVRGGGLLPADRRVPSVPAAGGLYATAVDLGRFLAGWRDLLPEELATDAVSPQFSIGDGRWQGFGWKLCETDGHLIAHHGGGVMGFRSSLHWDTRTGRASVVLINSEYDRLETLNTALLRIK